MPARIKSQNNNLFGHSQLQQSVPRGTWNTLIIIEASCSVTSSFTTALDCLSWHFLSVVSQAKSGHRINEECCEIDTPSILAGGVIRREDVMVIVVTFTNGTSSHPEVLSGVDALIVWPFAPHMSNAVDGPSYVQRHRISQQWADVERSPPVLIPVIPGHQSRECKAKEYHRRQVESNTIQFLKQLLHSFYS